MATASTRPIGDTTLKTGNLNFSTFHADRSSKPSDDGLPSMASHDVKQMKTILSYWELSTNGRLSGYETDNVTKFMSISPRTVTRHRYDKKYLCIEYGPEAGLQHIFFCFDSREDADEWEDAIAPRSRSKTEGQITNRNRVTRKKEDRYTALPAEGFDTLIDETFAEDEQQPRYVESDTMRQSDDGIYVDSTAPNSFESVSEPQSLSSTNGIDTRDNLSTLRYERNQPSIDVTYEKDKLLQMELDFTARGNCLYVTGWKTRVCNLNIGDCILQVGSLQPENEREVKDYIERTTADSVTMKIQRFPQGTMCLVNINTVWLHSRFPAGHSLGIELKGSEITVMNRDSDVRQSCDPSWTWFEEFQSTRSITAINDNRVPFYASTETVEAMLEAALRDDSILVLQLHPTTMIKALTNTSNASGERRLLNSESLMTRL